MSGPSPEPSAAISPTFSFPIRVYWEDTDAGGVVYHASYLCFLERGRTEWVRALGISQHAVRASDDLVLAVRAMQIDFLRPARLDDQLRVTVAVDEVRSASFSVAQELFRGDECLVRARVCIASLRASTFKPRPLPGWMLAGPTPAPPTTE